MRLFLAIIILQAIAATGNSQNVVVAAEHFNILTAGVQNPISIAVANVPMNLLVIKAKMGKVEKVGKAGDGHFIYVGTQAGPEEISVYKNENGKLKLLGKKFFSVKHFPLLEAFVGNSAGGSVMKKSFLAPGGVIGRFSDFDAPARIISYTVCIMYHDSCAFKLMPNLGNRWNEEIKIALETLRNNDMVFFKDIQATGPSGEIMDLSPLAFKITDDEKN